MLVPSNKAFTLMLSPKQIAEDTTDHGLDVSNEWSQVNVQNMTQSKVFLSRWKAIPNLMAQSATRARGLL